jgi:oligoribonuclease (3'-5' exoribonuclease)
MNDQPTCGQGLAKHSALPAKLSALLAAVAENLEAHLTALDPHDEMSRPEYDAYLDLAKQHRELASRLRSTAEQMAGCRDLPMARHDPSAMASPRVKKAFEELIVQEQELLELLQEWVGRDRAMLAEFSGTGGAEG